MPIVSPPSFLAPLQAASITPVIPPQTTAAPRFAISEPTSSASLNISGSALLEPTTPMILNAIVNRNVFGGHKHEPVFYSKVGFPPTCLLTKLSDNSARKNRRQPPMPDIRDRMEEDKGILKKIQNFIPGFSGYRKREDLRDADKMLRMQLAAKLGMQRKGLEECRGLVMKSYGSKELDMLGGLISHFKKLEGLVGHAQTGYSGFVAGRRIKKHEVNRLYEFDAAMIDHIVAISASIDSLKNAMMSADEQASYKELMTAKARINAFEEQFNRRLNV